MSEEVSSFGQCGDEPGSVLPMGGCEGEERESKSQALRWACSSHSQELSLSLVRLQDEIK